MGLLDKFPDDLKLEPEFKVILEHVRKKGIKEKKELRDFLWEEIDNLEKWIRENKRKGGTAVKDFRDKAMRLGILKKCEKLVQTFLF